MMKKTICACIAATTASGAAYAESISVSTTVGFESRYVFRGVQFAETSFQPAIELAYGNFYGGAWLNLPVGDDDLVVTPGGEELDLYLGYSFSANELLSLDFGLTYYTFPEAASGFFDLFEEDDSGLGVNTVELFAGAELSAPLSPSLYIYRDFNFDTFTIEGGLSHSTPLTEDISFDLGGSIGYVIDDDPGDYLYGAASADLSYTVSDHGSISGGIRYGGSDIAGGSIIDDSIAGTRKSSGLWFGISFNAEL